MEARPTLDFAFARRCAMAAVIAVAIYGALCAVWLLVNPLLLLFLAIVVAIGMRGAARWISDRTGMSRAVALGLTALVLYGGPLGAAAALAPQAKEQFTELKEQIPRLRERVDGWLHKLDWHAMIQSEEPAKGGGKKPAEAPAPGEPPPESEGSPTEAALTAFEGGPSDQALSWVTGFVGTLGSAVGASLFVAVVSLYLAASPRLYEGGVLKLFPIAVRGKAREVLDEIAEQLQRWIIGQVIASLIVAVLTTLGLMALGVPMALLFGALAGMFDFIPNFGPAIAALPAILVASGNGKVIHVLVLFLLIQGFEGWILRPFIEKKAVDTPPAVLITSQVILGSLFGFMGLLLAPALIVVVHVLLMRLWIEEALGDDAPDAPAELEREAD